MKDEHVVVWLSAYHDGELRGMRLRMVENHLSKCPDCRAELEVLQQISVLLQEAPSAAVLTPADRFVSQVGLQLSEQEKSVNCKRVLEIGWWLVPMVILAVLSLLQVYIMLLNGLQFAAGLGVDITAFAWLVPGGAADVWVMRLLESAFTGKSQDLLILFETLLQAWQSIKYIVIMVVLGMLYCSWMVSLWIRLQRRFQHTHD